MKHEQASVRSHSGELLLRKEGGASEIAFSLAEMTPLKDAVFSHNHPKGKSFSKEDILFAAKCNLAEIRAVGTDQWGNRWLYRFERPDNGWPELETVRKAAFDNESDIRAIFFDRIETGAMTREEADASHHHALWTSASRTIGGRYSRMKV